MANRSRSTFRRGISETQRRKKAWIDMNLGPVQPGFDISGSKLVIPSVSSATGSVGVLQFFSQPGFLESTLLRIRGNLTVPKSLYENGTTLEVFCFGIGVVSDDAASALAVPNPATATGYDWDGWLFLRQGNSEALEPNAEIVDVKAMRKWKSGDSIVFVAGGATANAAGYASTDIKFSLRGLFLLP